MRLNHQKLKMFGTKKINATNFPQLEVVGRVAKHNFQCVKIVIL